MGRTAHSKNGYAHQRGRRGAGRSPSPPPWRPRFLSQGGLDHEPLIIDISVAILTAKIAMLMKSGFSAMAHEARVDCAMLLGSIFLLLVGAGPLSLEQRFAGRAGKPRD
jgi:hypothetical protein